MIDDLTRAVLRVGDGRGFVVKRGGYLGREERVVITAAHCLDVFAMAPKGCRRVTLFATWRKKPTRACSPRWVPSLRCGRDAYLQTRSLILPYSVNPTIRALATKPTRTMS
jgi:hypothetical protein